MAKQAQASFEFGTELSPNFDLFIEGIDASAANPIFEAIRPLISSIRYEEDEEMASLFELNIINQPDVKIGLGSHIDWRAVLDCKAFQEGNGIDLFMGYAGSKTYMGRVEIVKWLPRFMMHGPTEFSIKGYDGRHRMMVGNQYRVKAPKEIKSASKTEGKVISLTGKASSPSGGAQKKKHVYRGVTDDIIVQQVASKYGYASDCDKAEKGLTPKAFNSSNIIVQKKKLGTSTRRTSSVPSRVQTVDQTDWQFLQELARINRYDLWVDFSLDLKQWVVHFKKRPDAGEAIFTFSYQENDGSLLEAEPDFSIAEQPTSVEISYFDKKAQAIEMTTIEDVKKEEDVKFQSSRPGDFVAKKSISVGARVRFTAFGQCLEAFSDKPFRSRKDAENFVKDWLKERERDLILMKGKVVGIESLRPRQIHELTGLSSRLDGFYRFTQVRHVMDNGQPYIVEFVAYKILSEEITRQKPSTKTTTKKKLIIVSNKQVQ